MASSAGDSVVAQPSSKRKAVKKEIPSDEKLVTLRKLFKTAGSGDNSLDAYIIPSEDAHQVSYSIFYVSNAGTIMHLILRVHSITSWHGEKNGFCCLSTV
jgi:hypothetical protein